MDEETKALLRYIASSQMGNYIADRDFGIYWLLKKLAISRLGDQFGEVAISFQLLPTGYFISFFL